MPRNVVAAAVDNRRTESLAIPSAVIDRRHSVNAAVRALLGAIWVYQRTLSPALPAVFGSACGCRFSPTCSHYAAEAVRTHGFFAGAWLALRRLVKCTPLHPGGFDAVPPPSSKLRRARPSCHSALPSALARRPSIN